MRAHNEDTADDYRTGLAVAWHIAAFGRAKKMPSFDAITKINRPVSKRELSARLRAAFDLHNARLMNKGD